MNGALRTTACRRTAALAVLVAGLWLLGGASGWGHAVLESTTPADGSSVEEAPAEVRLDFDEPVDVPTDGVRVFDADGERVDVGDSGPAADDPSVVRVGLPADLPDGTYVVTYRARSDDSHPIKGAFVFSVGAGGAVDDSLVARLFAGGADRPYAVAAAVLRWLAYGGALAAAGLTWFLVGVARDPDDRRRTTRWARGAAWLALAASLPEIPVQAALVTGRGLSALVSPGPLGEIVADPFGVAVLVRTVALVGLLVLVRGSTRWAAGAGALAVLAWLVEGHTRTSDPRWVMLGGDAVHLLAAATWLGGLVAVGLAVRARRDAEDPVGAAELVSGFSRQAGYALAAVVAAGVAMSWVQVRAVRALTSTTYGWTLVAKVAAALVVIGLGAYNRRALVPAVARAGSGAWRRLRTTVRLEIVGLVLVLLATAVLVNLQPAADEAGITGAYSTYVPLGETREVNLVVDPNRVGTNQIHLYVLDETGRPASDVEDLQLRLTQPDRDIGPLVRTPEVAGPGHWILTGPELSVPGRWVIEVVAGLGRFDEASVEVSVTVNP